MDFAFRFHAQSISSTSATSVRAVSRDDMLETARTFLGFLTGDKHDD